MDILRKANDGQRTTSVQSYVGNILEIHRHKVAKRTIEQLTRLQPVVVSSRLLPLMERKAQLRIVRGLLGAGLVVAWMKMAWEGLAARAKTRHERINIFVRDVYHESGPHLISARQYEGAVHSSRSIVFERPSRMLPETVCRRLSYGIFNTGVHHVLRKFILDSPRIIGASSSFREGYRPRA
jgi:hypothetical protein